jgi:hypothetical protein
MDYRQYIIFSNPIPTPDFTFQFLWKIPVFNAVQVRLLMKEDEFDDLPDYDSLFRDDDVSSIT